MQPTWRGTMLECIDGAWVGILPFAPLPGLISQNSVRSYSCLPQTYSLFSDLQAKAKLLSSKETGSIASQLASIPENGCRFETLASFPNSGSYYVASVSNSRDRWSCLCLPPDCCD